MALWSSMGDSYYRYEVILNLVGTVYRIQDIQDTKFKIIATTA